MEFLDSPTTRERRYRVNRTSRANPLNMPRGLPLMTGRRSVYVQEMPVGLQVFNRIHSAIASAERRLLMTPDEESQQPHVHPILQFGQENPQQSAPQHNQGMYGLLPRTQAPIEFECGVCFEKIHKGQPQQLLNCGHKFCGACFDRWHAQSGNTTCPSCRTPVHTNRMSQPPRGRHTPIRIQTSSRFSGSQGMTPQQQAMAMFMRNRNF